MDTPEHGHAGAVPVMPQHLTDHQIEPGQQYQAGYVAGREECQVISGFCTVGSHIQF